MTHDLRRYLRRAPLSIARLLGLGRGGDRVAVLHEVTAPERLRHRLEWLDLHFEVVDLETLLKGEGGSGARVALTFDDGMRSWHTVVRPVLEEMTLSATFFVCSGFIDAAGSDLTSFVRTNLRRSGSLEPLTWEQVAELAAHPLFEVGAHSRRHLDLGALEPGEVEREIVEDVRRIEDQAGCEVRYLAYPFGQPEQLPESAGDTLARAGLEGAFTTVPGPVTARTDRRYLPRHGLDLREPRWVWRAVLRGAYDPIYAAKRRVL